MILRLFTLTFRSTLHPIQELNVKSELKLGVDTPKLDLRSANDSSARLNKPSALFRKIFRPGREDSNSTARSPNKILSRRVKFRGKKQSNKHLSLDVTSKRVSFRREPQTTKYMAAMSKA